MRASGHAGPPCPRCAGRAPAAAGPYCPYCGAHRAVLRWVAHPPPSAAPPAPPRPSRRYPGPPRYRVPPRWGFAARPWPQPVVQARTDPLPAARSLATSAVATLWATAVVALLATGAEAWRYWLLLASRDRGLPARLVAASDAFVASAGTVAPIMTVLAGGLLVGWSVRAAQAAACRAGLRPARSTRAVVCGWLVPGLNLAVPGPVLAEIEHAALGRPAGQRPRPSRLVLGWWALWVTGVLLAAVVLLWSLRTGVQAMADGVLAHAVLDLLAAVTAGWSAVLVTRLTRLLGPARAGRRELLVRVAA